MSGRLQIKKSCALHLPSKDINNLSYNLAIENVITACVYTFVLQVKTAETRSVRHFHFTAWPDHGVPETTELLISFRHLVREHMDQYSKHSPTVVHCRSDRTNTDKHTLHHWLKTAETVFKNMNMCLSLLFCIAPTQCWCGTHRYLHSYWPSDFPDWKGQSCRRVWHRPWSAHAPAPYGADRGRTQSHTVHCRCGPSCLTVV